MADMLKINYLGAICRSCYEGSNFMKTASATSAVIRVAVSLEM